jgi:hypothetical protein
MKLFMRLSFAFLLSTAAFAQTGSPAGSTTTSSSGVLGGVMGPVPTAVVASGAGWSFSSAGRGMPGGTITGAPYSAEQVTEHVQTLADGTHITQPPQTIKLYRDSVGRTRTERTAPLPPGPLGVGVQAPVFIDIADPAAGVRYTLESQSHTAHKVAMRAPAPPPPPPPPGANGVQAARRLQLLPALVPAQSGPVPQDQTSGPQFSHESLGTQTIEGVLAEGSRTTVTYPMGAIGNDRPITTTSETWNSPELKMVVLSKNSDPRNGESTTRLTNISRAEPDASLFQVPPDYEVIDPQTAVPKR